jgi:hypothetical protein
VRVSEERKGYEGPSEPERKRNGVIASGVIAIRSDSSRRHGPASCSALDWGGAMPAGEVNVETASCHPCLGQGRVSS